MALRLTRSQINRTYYLTNVYVTVANTDGNATVSRNEAKAVNKPAAKQFAKVHAAALRRYRLKDGIGRGKLVGFGLDAVKELRAAAKSTGDQAVLEARELKRVSPGAQAVARWLDAVLNG
jgi:hypothetical protein